MRRTPKLRVIDPARDARRLAKQIDHAVVVELGGRHVVVSDTTPDTRAECPDTSTRCCPYLRCRHHLGRIEGEERPGRYRASLDATYRLEVLRSEQPSCALDIVEAHPAGMSSAEVAPYLKLGKRRVEMLVKRALEKLRAAGADVGDIEAMEALDALTARPRGNEPT